MFEVHYQNGVQLPNFDLWLDPSRRRGRAVVSHAHADHFEPHEEIWCSEPTARLIEKRYAPKGAAVHALPYHECKPLGPGQLTLLPAGHILGSAQAYLESDEGSLLYTGDFKLRAGLSAESTVSCPAETLIMETTFGLPHFRFPPMEAVCHDLVRFCVDAQAEGALPVLIGYSLGKAQEIQALLHREGFSVVLHESVYRMARIYHELAPEFPVPKRFDAKQKSGVVLIVPPSTARSRWLKMLGPVKKAILTGWAMMPGAIYRYQVDAAFPLSDHADFDDLCRYVEMVNPRRVLTLHGYAGEFAAHLRAQGVEAWALTGVNQLELSLKSSPDMATGHLEPAATVPTRVADSEFGEFAELGERIAATTSRRDKIETLSEYLIRHRNTSLEHLTRWLGGSPFASHDTRRLTVGWALLRRALVAVAGGQEGELRRISKQYQDAGRTTETFLRSLTKPVAHSLDDVQDFFNRLADGRGPSTKLTILIEWLRGCSSLEAMYTVKLITGDLRVGLKQGLVEEGLAQAFDQAADQIRSAHMILGDLGDVARLAERNALGEASPRLLRPLKVMLASPETSAEAIYQRYLARNESPVIWVEPKYDGIRLQAHVSKGSAELFSRDLHCVSGQFPEIQLACQNLPDAILDGELIAYGPEGVLPFQELQKRLGRKEPDLFLQASTPLRYVIFDCLYLGERSLLEEPLEKRRRLLEGLALPDALERVGGSTCSSTKELEGAFLQARRERTEGLLCKDPTSPYTPGRRGMAWLKLKKAFATLDVVVVAVEQGHGKRHDLLSDYTFAVRDEETEELLVIGKAYSGLTDQEITELGERFRMETVRERGRKLHVRPAVVLEVAFDSIQPSTRHNSGLSLRFPRIARIREDKGLADINTLREAQALAGI